MTQKYTLYNGEVILEFEERYHQYRVEGEVVDGVTSAISVLNKPALVWWAANVVAEYWKEEVEKLLANGTVIDELVLKELFEASKRTHDIAKKKSADLGTLTHGWLENYIKARIAGEDISAMKMPVNEKMLNGVSSFLEWEKKNSVEFLFSEKPVYSRKHRYAGTTDFECRIDGKIFVGDIKTSNAVYEEMALQVAAYQLAREEETGQEYYGRVIVRVGKDDGEVEERFFMEHDKDKRAFLRALGLSRRMKELKEELKRV